MAIPPAQQKHYKLLLYYWITYSIYLLKLCLTPPLPSSFLAFLPLIFFGFSGTMMIIMDARYKKAYEAQVKNYRLLDSLMHKWTHDPNIDIYNKMFFFWLAALILSVISFWVIFGIQYIRFLSTLRT